MKNRVVRGVVAIITAFTRFVTGIMVYATAKTFNPIFSGKFTCTPNCYMIISDNDAIMHSVFYPVSAQTTRFLAASNVDSLIFDKNQFVALYDHDCDITYSDGTFIQKIKGPIYIEVSDVQVNKLNFWGQPKVMTIVYNGHDYTSE